MLFSLGTDIKVGRDAVIPILFVVLAELSGLGVAALCLAQDY
jgi:hypothetical protein